jgi:crotonobetainyl-CoA:carnitine CoA-transferase CaiB-like acyl-CoA transferase
VTGTLDDIRIIDATGPIGHYAGRLLADLGADVIKVEPRGGDPARHWAPFFEGLAAELPEHETSVQFLLLNANKRSIELDLARAEDREAFRKLVATADVLLESWSLPEREALGFGADAFDDVRPDLVRASVTGWGLSGPYASWAYADIVGEAMSGVMNLSGFLDGPPMQLPDQQGYHCASINVTAGVLAALLHRDASGEGQQVEVTMHESLPMAEETAMQGADINGVDRERTGGSGRAGAIGITLPGLGVYETKDGHIYSMCTGNAGSGFPGLVELMQEIDDPGFLIEEPYHTFINTQMNTGLILQLMQDPSAASDVASMLKEMDDYVVEFYKRHETQALYERGQELRVLLGAIAAPGDISQSPQLVARDWFVEIEDPARGRTLRYPGPPWQLRGTPATLRRPAPLLGEHTVEVLTEAGLSENELSALSTLAS